MPDELLLISSAASGGVTAFVVLENIAFIAIFAWFVGTYIRLIPVALAMFRGGRDSPATSAVLLEIYSRPHWLRWFCVLALLVAITAAIPAALLL